VASLRAVLRQYRKLQTYCDTWFKAIVKKYPRDFVCKKGCGECCVLNGVCMLEAYSMTRAIKKTPLKKIKPNRKPSNGICVFLHDEFCSVYAYRPIICRTHGLPIKSAFIQSNYLDCCPKNSARGLSARLAPEDVFPLDVVNENLMRLNLAFCLLWSDPQLADKRLTMRDIRAGKIPR
jgi:uncharacterized protein